MSQAYTKYASSLFWLASLGAMAAIATMMQSSFQHPNYVRGKHVWIEDAGGGTVEAILAELSRYQWMDVSPSNTAELVDQLNNYVPIRLASEFVEPDVDDFQRAKKCVDPFQKMDRALPYLLHMLQLDLAVLDGRLVVAGPSDSEDIRMTRLYDMPNVRGIDLRQAVEFGVFDSGWARFGGDWYCESLPSRNGSLSKFVVSAPLKVHRKIEALINQLGESYGWQSAAYLPLLPAPTFAPAVVSR